MIIELEPIFNNVGSRFDFDYSLDLTALNLNSGFPFDSPVAVSGCVKNSAGVVTLTANVNAVYHSLCDRCAEEIKIPMKIPVEHGIVASLSNEDDGEFIVVEDMRLNLDALITEDVILFVPNKLLCSEKCKGLCPQCGANLNSGQCGCEKPIDPRLEVLKQFLDKTAGAEDTVSNE
ncbi:MAG: DUF177 domain-containing protein [Clostridiales bacterium]|nr:DUF177 domain-containing protein [Clostridiales bacterium]